MLNTRSLSKKNTPESYCLKRVPQPRICLCHLNLHDADLYQTAEYASNYYQKLVKEPCLGSCPPCSGTALVFRLMLQAARRAHSMDKVAAMYIAI